MNPMQNTKRKAALFASLTALVLTVMFHVPLLWGVKKLQRQMSPEEIPERPVYDETAKAPVDLAVFMRDARRAWPQVGVDRVHAVTVAVATGLLLRSDIEVGSVVKGEFVPWRVAPWNAAGKIRAELGALPNLLSEPGRYVFRRRTS